MNKRGVIWLVAAIVSATLTVHAADPPAIQWERAFQSEDTVGLWVQQTMDRGFIVSGYVSNSYDHHQMDFYLLKTDSLGNTQWQMTFGGPSHNGPCRARQTADGGYIINGGDESLRTVLLKTDSLGNQLWQYTGYPGSPADVQQTSDGGYVNSGLRPDSVYLRRVDSLGNSLWRGTYQSSYRDWSYSDLPVLQTQDGGYLVGAQELLKTDSLGAVKWRKTYGRMRVMFGLLKTSDGCYVATGLGDSAGLRGLYACLLKIDPQGDLMWKKVFTADGQSGGHSVSQTQDGGYFICGENGYGYVLRTDSLGNVLWTKTLQVGYRWALSGQQTADGGYIVAIHDHLMKLAPDGPIKGRNE